MFDPVDPKQSFPALEHGMLRYWAEEDIFRRSVKERDPEAAGIWEQKRRQGKGFGKARTFSFYDGPPFATGLPHYGHLLAGTIKDVIPRYKTMRGYKVERRFGWDCHGLPVENLVEQENGVKSRKEIEERGIAWFNAKCRASVQRYTAQWRKTVERTGRWVDMDFDYRTMDPEYMESIWWVFKQLYEKGLVYEGYKPMHICPRCVTPLSNFEVTLGYKEVSDEAVIVKFMAGHGSGGSAGGEGGKHGKYILAWTTTPWTLPGNVLLAVGEEIRYAEVEYEGDIYVLAESLVENVFAGKEFDVVNVMPGKSILGTKYEPLFPYFSNFGEKCFAVVQGNDFVSTKDGTGVVHIATGFGEDDYRVGEREGVGVLQHVMMDGRFTDAVADFAGEEVKPMDDPGRTDQKIIRWLESRGRLFSKKKFTHSYPHCWRCDAPLLNYAANSWFVAVEKIKGDILKANEETQWVPRHIRDGRFGEWLNNARDWAISRNRYWGTPLPIWRRRNRVESHAANANPGKNKSDIVVIGSRDELMEKCPDRFTKITVLRHAESEGNLIPIYQGKCPGTNLTKRGRKQAKTVGRILSGNRRNPKFSIFNLPLIFKPGFSSATTRKISVIYASPLARTRQTAGIIARQTGAKVIVDDRIREIDFGDWEGKTVDFSDLTFVKERRAHKIDRGKAESIYHFDGMETWASVQERVQKFFEDILPKHKGEHIAVVTHADPAVNVRHFFTREDPVKLSQRPYPKKAEPSTYFWDHEKGAQMDLHRETADSMAWDGFRRVPEVFDCWFESGAMPYAQANFPFSQLLTAGSASPKDNRRLSDAGYPEGFPADFIAEGIDQTRGWFYTLMVISTALFKRPAFRHCVVNGIVLAEDGRKMSKRLKNYPEPDQIMEKYGADAMRFTLMASPAVRGESLRFSGKAVEKTLRRVILPLWNAYSFFVLHVNEAEHGAPEKLRVTNGKMRECHEFPIGNKRLIESEKPKHPMDRWILAEIQGFVNRITEELENYDLSDACAQIYDTLDALTNWYVRRSRRRFAGKEGGEQRDAAICTLHHVLVTLSKALAPICPFVTDVIFLNLVPGEHNSVHLAKWPEVRDLVAEEKSLIEKTGILRTIVKLGMRLRAEANMKVRQPLALADVVAPVELGSGDRKILAEELNVKEVRVLSDASDIAEKIVEVNARAAGPRLGSKVQEVIKEAKAGNFKENADGTVTILGERLSHEEAKVVLRGKEGRNVASEKRIVVGLDTDLTEGLKMEGLVRDIIRGIQSRRKEKGLHVGDQITLEAGSGVAGVLQKFQGDIERETNGKFGKSVDGRLHIVISESGACIARP